MKFSVCIDMMLKELDFYDRIDAVKKCGIDTIEFWKWSNKDTDQIRRRLDENNMGVSIFNLDSCNEILSWRLSRGILNSGDKDSLIAALRESAPVYRKLRAQGVIVLVGESISELSYDRQIDNIHQCLKAAAPIAEAEGVSLFVEPLNATDRPNYFMPYSKPLLDILKDINSNNVKLLFDIYHQQMTEGGIIDKIKDNIGYIGHFHVADCPGRHEPGTGELNYPKILNEIDKLGFSGFIGFEYRATKNDMETLEALNV